LRYATAPPEILLHVTMPDRVAWAIADLQGGGRGFESLSAHRFRQDWRSRGTRLFLGLGPAFVAAVTEDEGTGCERSGDDDKRGEHYESAAHTAAIIRTVGLARRPAPSIYVGMIHYRRSVDSFSPRSAQARSPAWAARAQPQRLLLGALRRHRPRLGQ
jgi:hypothetical protein